MQHLRKGHGNRDDISKWKCLLHRYEEKLGCFGARRSLALGKESKFRTVYLPVPPQPYHLMVRARMVTLHAIHHHFPFPPKLYHLMASAQMTTLYSIHYHFPFPPKFYHLISRAQMTTRYSTHHPSQPYSF